MDGWRIAPQRLRNLRTQVGLTQADMARELGCHYRHYCRFETTAAYGSEPSRELGEAICAIFTRKLNRKIALADIADPAPSRFKAAG